MSSAGIRGQRDTVPAGGAGGGRGVPGARVLRARRAGGRVVRGGAAQRARARARAARPPRPARARAAAAPRGAAHGGRLPAAGRGRGRAAAAPGGAAPVTRAGGGAAARARPPLASSP